MAYAQLSTRNTSGLHPNLRGLGFLGDNGTSAITADAAFQQALSAYAGKNVNSRDSGNPAWISANEQQIAAGQFNPYPGCTGQAPNVNLFQTASGLALGTTAAGVGILGSSSVGLIPAAAVPVVGWVIAGVGAIVSIIGAIFKHHAAAVTRDLNFSCGAVPAVNNAFRLIAQAVQSGNMSPTDAANALPEIYSQFMAAGGASGSESGPGGIPSGGTAINDSPYCNSNCELSICVLGMVIYWRAQYQALAAQQAYEKNAAVQSAQASATQPAESPASPGTPAAKPGLESVPPWAWIALALFGAWAVL